MEKEVNHLWCRETAARYQSSSTSAVFSCTRINSLRYTLPLLHCCFNFVYCSPQEDNVELINTNPLKAPLMWFPSRAVTVAVTTASPVVVGCHRGCLLPPAVVHVTSRTL